MFGTVREDLELEAPMTVGEFCNREVVICTPEDTLRGAARLMRDHHVGCLVVIARNGDPPVPVGILTDRDIIVGPVAAGVGELLERNVSDFMTKEPLTAKESESLTDAMARMRAAGVRRMPVVNDQGRLEGLVAFDDLVELLADEIRDLAELLSRERKREQHGLPVCTPVPEV